MAVVTLTINDQLISARQDQTLLEVIREQSIDLPTLCFLEGLTKLGGCRLCMVEMQNNPRLLAACTTPVQEGMVIFTHTERLMSYRKMIIEMLLAERNHICAVCVSNGHCELQAVAAHLGVDHVRYDYLCPDLPMDTSHSRYGIDHNRCILCLRCVRVCDEIEGAHTWDAMGRGIKSRTVTDMNQPWGDSRSCTLCGKCVQVCPTGALFTKGSSVAEMEKQHEFLSWIITGREKKQWTW